jgi:hypothetical protein
MIRAVLYLKLNSFPALAFEISLEEADDDEGTQGLVKKHPPRPPRRLQRLSTLEPPTPSLSDLQEKLESAEKRRLSVILTFNLI